METAIMLHVLPRRLNMARVLWTAVARRLHVGSVCDRCKRAMLESCERRGEHVCIVCLAHELESRPQALAQSELAGCAAVLRQLMQELKTVRGEHGTPAERAHEDALLDVALEVVWGITPPNLRVPSKQPFDELIVCAALDRFERAWGLMTGRRSLTATFRLWQQMQARAQRYIELAAVEERFAALVHDDLSGRVYMRRQEKHERRQQIADGLRSSLLEPTRPQ